MSLAVLVVLTGCTGSPATQPQPTTSTTSLSPTQPEPTPTFTLQQVQKLDLGTREAWPVVLTPTELLAPVTSNGSAGATEVIRFDLATGEQAVVARTQWPDGAIGGVAASGQWIVWVDLRRVQTGTTLGGVHWEIWAKDLTGGQQVMLDTNGADVDTWPDGSAPSLISGDGYVGWARRSTDQTVQQQIWQPGDTSPQTLPLQLDGFSGASAIGDGKLIFILRPATYLGEEVGLGDCWSYPLDGSAAPQRLTFSGLVQRCTLVGSHLVWAEHIDPNGDKAQVAKTGDLPYLLMSLSLAGTYELRIVHQGIMRPEGPVVGTDFAWWSSGSRPVISSLDTTAELQVKNADQALTLVAAASDQLLAYQLKRSDGTTVIAVVRVVSLPAPPAGSETTPAS